MEVQEADQLRGAVTEGLCRSKKRRADFKEALVSIQTEDSLDKCARIAWDGREAWDDGWASGKLQRPRYMTMQSCCDCLS